MEKERVPKYGSVVKHVSDLAGDIEFCKACGEYIDRTDDYVVCSNPWCLAKDLSEMVKVEVTNGKS